MKVKSKFFEFNPENKPIEYNNKERFESKTNLTNKNPLILIKNEINHGFAEGNNIGIRFALKKLNPNYILLLNNDTVVDKNFLNVIS